MIRWHEGIGAEGGPGQIVPLPIAASRAMTADPQFTCAGRNRHAVAIQRGLRIGDGPAQRHLAACRQIGAKCDCQIVGFRSGPHRLVRTRARVTAALTSAGSERAAAPSTATDHHAFSARPSPPPRVGSETRHPGAMHKACTADA